MKIWLVQANEPMPIIDKNQRPFRTGMLAERLSEKGHYVTWFATTFEHYTKVQRFNKNKIVDVSPNLTLNLVWSPGYKKNVSVKRIYDHKLMAIRMKKEMRKVDKPDLIYCSFPTIDLADIAIKFGEKNGIKVIIDVRDLWPDIFLDRLMQPYRFLAKPYYELCNYKTKRILKKAFAIHSVSEKALEWSLNKAGRVRNQKDYSYFIGSGDEGVFDINKKTQSCILITGFGKSINYDLIVSLAKKLPSHFQLKMVGDGPELENFKNLGKDCPNIIFYGWCDRKKMDEELKDASFAFLAYNNSFDFQVGAGNKFGQALSYSLPVIVTCQGVMESLLNEYSCGIYSENTDDISSFMLSMINDKEKYLELSKNAKKLYDEQFNSKIIYEKLSKYIENMEEN